MNKFMKRKLATGFILAAFAAVGFTTTSCHSTNKNAADSTITKKDSTPKATGIVAQAQDPNKEYVYLTFDDGPQPPGTPHVFDLCKELGVKATFFVVGANMSDDYRKTFVDSMRSSYPQFVICNHSTTHAFFEKYKLFYNKPDSAIQDFLHAQKQMNIPYKIIRLPGNSAWVRQGEVTSTKQCHAVCERLDSLGYNVIGWDVEWGLSKGKGQQHPAESADKIIEMIDHTLNTYTHTHNNVVILTHDRLFAQPASVDSLRKVITALKNNPKYVLQTIDQYPRLKTQ